MDSVPQSMGLIAGSRSLPLLFAKTWRAQHLGSGIKTLDARPRLLAVAFEGETDPAIAALVDEVVWLKVGQLSKLIQVFTARGVRQCVMLGQIAPRNLYAVRPDLRALGVLLRLKQRNAHSIFGAIASELARDGVELVSAAPWLQPFMPGPGFWLGRKLSAAQRADVEFGFKLAKEVSRLEIGQLVVVKEGTVLAVEGFEGTDACLLRGGELAGKAGGAVAVKVAKPGHDMRFDVPCVGPQTLESCARAGVAVLALEAGKSLLLEQEACAALAERHKLAVATVG